MVSNFHWEAEYSNCQGIEAVCQGTEKAPKRKRVLAKAEEVETSREAPPAQPVNTDIGLRKRVNNRDRNERQKSGIQKKKRAAHH